MVMSNTESLTETRSSSSVTNTFYNIYLSKGDKSIQAKFKQNKFICRLNSIFQNKFWN